MFDKVPKKPEFPKQEMDVLKFWEDNGIVKKSFEQNSGKDPFIFYEGPPTANGMPHVGHVLTRVIKDVFLRFRAMSGFDVLRKAGWDTHGLPVEIQVEKDLGLKDKHDIEKYGVAEFVAKCRESVFAYEAEWRKMTERIGFWVDLDEPYITCENNYIESVWWILKQFHEKDLLYKGHKIVPHCPRCDTALSSHEVSQGYEDVDDPSVFVKMRIKSMENTSFLVWTTTPWTLISNVALAFDNAFEYVKVKVGDEYLILAEGRLEAVFGDERPEVVEGFKGRDLTGLDYEPLFNFCDLGGKKAFYSLPADFVTLAEGTGIVHMAPAFGEDDYKMGEKHELPFLQPVDTNGKFTEEITPWKGVFIKAADPDIMKDLESRGLMFKSGTYNHSYPFCWRCKSPLIYYARSSWFVRTTAYRDVLLDVNESINWIPEHIKKGRMGDFLENNIDWAVSRDRYWGTPLNLWICEKDDKHILAVDSAAELKKHAIDYPDGELDLHKPHVDAVHCKCPDCDGTMTRTHEVIDCWLDSGAMPYAQWHYPHENKDVFESLFPADFITEAVDQTRGWFYSLMALGSLLFKKSPFKNCIVMGHVLDADGIKMAKSVGNVIEPDDAFNEFGADAFRWLFYRENNPWIPTRFSEDSLREIQKVFFINLWNTYSFFVIYANIDEFDPKEHRVKREDLDIIDRWVLSRLNHAAREVRNHLNEYQVMPAARILEVLLDDISNWYIRRCRDRFWKHDKDTDKWAAYSTLYDVLIDFLKLLAPFSPFVAETIFQNLRAGETDPESVHLCKFPEPDITFMNKDLEMAMQLVRDISNEGRMLRSKTGLKVRQPLRRIYVKMKGAVPEKFDDLLELVRDELNIREVEIVKDFDMVQAITLKPSFKLLGPKYGKDMKAIGEFFESIEDHSEIGKNYTRNNLLEINIKGTHYSFGPDELEVHTSAMEGIVMGEMVALDTRLDDELREAGRLRELVHHIQNIRKEQDLDYAARITITYSGAPEVASLFEKFAGYIKTETLAAELAPGLPDGEGEAMTIEGYDCRLKVTVN
ncbi:isoleucine--tRNA ligase [bacterium]